MLDYCISVVIVYWGTCASILQNPARSSTLKTYPAIVLLAAIKLLIDITIKGLIWPSYS